MLFLCLFLTSISLPKNVEVLEFLLKTEGIQVSCNCVFNSEFNFEFLLGTYLCWDMLDSLLMYFLKLVGSFKYHSFSAELIHRIQINLMCTWWCSSEVKTFGRTQPSYSRNISLKNFFLNTFPEWWDRCIY